MEKIVDHETATSILRDIYNGNDKSDERSPGRIASSGSVLNRHRVGASPVRVKRSTNDSVPTAVVPPTPPSCNISTKTISGATSAYVSAKTNFFDVGGSDNRFISFKDIQTRFSPASSSSVITSTPVFTGSSGGGSSLSRRSHSSIGSIGLGLARKLEFEEREGRKPYQHQPNRNKRGCWLGDNLDAELQAPSNSILTLHSLMDDNRSSNQSARDDSQERRMNELEARLREIEVRLASANAANKRDAIETASVSKIDTTPKWTVSEPSRTPSESRPMMTTVSKPQSGTRRSGDFGGVLSVAVPPMIAADGGIFRVQPTPRSEIKSQREIERLEKKLKHQEEVAESLRAQHYKQMEQLTRQLASNDDIMQTLRSRIRELELENELWQNRFRLYNDVDVAKILRENERLRARQRKRSSTKDEQQQQQENAVSLQVKEQIEEEQEKLRARCNELENRYRTVKEKYKEAIRAYRTRRRQDHIELESMKVTVELQNSELSDLRKRMFSQVSTAQEEPSHTAAAFAKEATNSGEFVKYNLDKCYAISDCLSTICTRIKRNEPLDPTEVLEYGTAGVAASKKRGDQKASSRDQEKSVEDTIEGLAAKLTMLHTMVVDIYGDDLANSVSCNVQ